MADDKKLRVRRIIAKLKKLFPDAKCALKYSSPWELVVAVQLSAQCTDRMVNRVTERLFQKYKTIEDYVEALPRQFEQDIFQTGFYRNKARNILAAAKMLKERYGGHVPDTMAEILKLPGIARKSANVILGNLYGVVEGIAVDTHVKRLSRVFGLTEQNNPDKIERDLMAIVPKKDWFKLTYLFGDYGRKYCPARFHDHATHP